MRIFKQKNAGISLSLIFLLTLLIFAGCEGTEKVKPNDNGLNGTISISGAFALYPMAIKWSEEFKKLHPDVKFEISAGGAGKGIADVLGGLVDLGAVSRDIDSEEVKKGANTFVVAKDAVIPTINSSNPNLSEILSRGLSKEVLSNIFITGTYKDWKQVGFAVSLPINVYNRSDAAGAAESWAKFFSKRQEDLQGVGVYGDPGLLQAVENDKSAIGFNNITYLFDAKTKKQLQGIAILPIDLNGNGKIDPDENFYNTMDDLLQAVKSGKLPTPPAREVYFVSKGSPQKKEVVEFLKWVLTDGQKYLLENGFISVSQDSLNGELKKL